MLHKCITVWCYTLSDHVSHILWVHLLDTERYFKTWISEWLLYQTEQSVLEYLNVRDKNVFVPSRDESLQFSILLISLYKIWKNPGHFTKSTQPIIYCLFLEVCFFDWKKKNRDNKSIDKNLRNRQAYILHHL